MTALTSDQPPSAAVRGPVTSASYSITVRLTADGDPASVGRIATAVGSAGGAVTAIDVVESRPDGLTVDVTCSAADAGGVVTGIDVADSRHDRLVVDVTCSAADADHALEIVAAVEAIDGVEVHKVSDRTFLAHLGGKIEIS